MPEPTVQVPVSLPTREQLVDAVTCSNPNGALDYEEAHADLVLEFLRKFYSQPTPTASLPGLTASELRAWRSIDAQQSARPAPPRIEDLAPGTILYIADPWIVKREENGTLHAVRQSWRNVLGLDDIDPSTIRDVTPPKDAA